MRMMVKERCCCGCSVLLGSQILATVSAITALCSIFTTIFSGMDWFYIMAQILYLFASVCAAGLVFQAIRTRKAILMAPQMLVAVINIVSLVIIFITCFLTGCGVHTYMNTYVESLYKSSYGDWFKTLIDSYRMNTDDALKSYARSWGWSAAFGSSLALIFAFWVFIVYFDCFRTLKAGEGYPTAQYHGDDNITVYPTHPAPSYDAAAAAASANPAPAYPGTPYDIPPSYANTAATTADELPAKVPLP